MFNKNFSHIWRDRKGAGLIEVGLIVGLVSVIAIASVSTLGDKVDGVFTDASQALLSSGIGSSEGAQDSGPSAPDYDLSSVIVLPDNGDGTSMTGWVQSSGASGWYVSLNSPFSNGSYFYYAGSSRSYSKNYFASNLPPETWDGVDNGLMQASLTWDQGSYESRDSGGMGLEFRDGSGALIDSVTSYSNIGPTRNWQSFSISDTVPAGTRRIDLILSGTRNAGSNNNVYVDNIVPALSWVD